MKPLMMARSNSRMQSYRISLVDHRMQSQCNSWQSNEIVALEWSLICASTESLRDIHKMHHLSRFQSLMWRTISMDAVSKNVVAHNMRSLNVLKKKKSISITWSSTPTHWHMTCHKWQEFQRFIWLSVNERNARCVCPTPHNCQLFMRCDALIADPFVDGIHA